REIRVRNAKTFLKATASDGILESPDDAGVPRSKSSAGPGRGVACGPLGRDAGRPRSRVAWAGPSQNSTESRPTTSGGSDHHFHGFVFGLEFVFFFLDGAGGRFHERLGGVVGHVFLRLVEF